MLSSCGFRYSDLSQQINLPGATQTNMWSTTCFSCGCTFIFDVRFVLMASADLEVSEQPILHGWRQVCWRVHGRLYLHLGREAAFFSIWGSAGRSLCVAFDIDYISEAVICGIHGSHRNWVFGSNNKSCGVSLMWDFRALDGLEGWTFLKWIGWLSAVLCHLYALGGCLINHLVIG